MADLAQVNDVEQAWRPLQPAEKTRAEYLLGVASRKVRRRWRDIDTRLAAGTLDRDDVRDVLVWMVLPVLGGPPVPGARSWQVSAGSESQSVTMGSGQGNPRDLMVLADWMVEIFDGPASTTAPLGHFPQGGRFERIFTQWPEGAAP